MESTIQNKMHCLSIINCYIACSSIILFIHFESVKGQNITLFKYNQNDAKTECILGLKSGKDIVVFKALVRDYHKADYVLFEIDKSGGKFWQSIHLDFKIPFASKYETVCLVRNYAIHINIYIGAPSEFSDATVDFKSTDSSNNDTVCIVRNETIHLNIYTTAENDLKKATIDFENLCPSNNDTECIDFNEPIHVHIYIKAETEYSKAKMKGSLFILGRYVTKSDEQTFPEIYDSSHATYTLTINGMDALKNESVCFINDNGSIPFELKLESSNQPLPCVLEIMSDEGTSTKKGPNGTAFIKIERKSMKGNITIKYGSCSLSENTRIIECSWENKDAFKQVHHTLKLF
ncbi:unnamed protein product [Lymnaea stagnalis]|uniref:Uncharacterized protein n=1 Tax=Lymnaea stagnalis TaxID=6523 RepID=A0AAV2I6V8_LYMST